MNSNFFTELWQSLGRLFTLSDAVDIPVADAGGGVADSGGGGVAGAGGGAADVGAGAADVGAGAADSGAGAADSGGGAADSGGGVSSGGGGAEGTAQGTTGGTTGGTTQDTTGDAGQGTTGGGTVPAGPGSGLPSALMGSGAPSDETGEGTDTTGEPGSDVTGGNTGEGVTGEGTEGVTGDGSIGSDEGAEAPQAAPQAAAPSAGDSSGGGFWDIFWTPGEDQEEVPAEDEAALEQQGSGLTLQDVGANGKIGDVKAAGKGHFTTAGIVALILFAAALATLATLLIRKLRVRLPFAVRLAGAVSAKGGPVLTTVQGLGARDNQQDSWVATDPNLYGTQGVLMCVADGMGGLENGEAVSKAAAAAVVNRFNASDKSDPQRLLVSLIQDANAAVNRLIAPNYTSSGTTLVIGYACRGRFYYASVGDSRICMYRDGELLRLNRPHVFAEELLIQHVNGGLSYEDAVGFTRKGALTSYLGMGQLKYLDIPQTPITIHEGDSFVVMSDGVFNTLNDGELEGILAHGAGELSELIRGEIERKKNPYQDNYSALVISF